MSEKQRYPDLPPVLAAIAEAVGFETMMKIAERYGGQRVKMPDRSGRRNWLIDLVGKEDAVRIVEVLGANEAKDIPLGPTGSFAALRRQLNRRYDELAAQEASASEIARSLGITTRAVFKRRAKEKQPDLFNEPEQVQGRE